MILTCPECATRFQIADNAIGPNGRTVRCSQCSHVWFVPAEPVTLDLADAQKLEELRQENEKDRISSPQSDLENVDENASLEQEAPSLAGAAVGAHAAIRETADRKRARRRLLGVGMIWIVTLAILAIFALAAFFLRAKIVEKFPGTAPFYKAMGLEANASGLEFYEVKTRYGTNEGVQMLFVDGKIKNFDVKSRDVDLIKLVFKNETGEELASWVVEPQKARLQSGEVLEFSSQYPDPPVDAVKLSQEFVTESSQKSGPSGATQ